MFDHQFSEDAVDKLSSTILVHEDSGETSEPGLEMESLEIPEHLPILPLRGVVVYPHTAVPLTIGQPRSIRLVDDVVTVVETEECDYCTECEAVCPTGAIRCPYEIVIEES